MYVVSDGKVDNLPEQQSQYPNINTTNKTLGIQIYRHTHSLLIPPQEILQFSIKYVLFVLSSPHRFHGAFAEGSGQKVRDVIAFEVVSVEAVNGQCEQKQRANIPESSYPIAPVIV
jgi:hypothetical protein